MIDPLYPTSSYLLDGEAHTTIAVSLRIAHRDALKYLHRDRADAYWAAELWAVERARRALGLVPEHQDPNP